MPSFFIDRPIFAWVVAILISLIGVIAMLNLGIDSYPDIAPPQVTVSANYPGASAATMESTVTQVIPPRPAPRSGRSRWPRSFPARRPPR